MIRLGESINPNPIVQAINQGDCGEVEIFRGFIGEGYPGKIEVYFDLSLETSLEIDQRDVIYVVDGKSPKEPSLVWVRGQARITVRHRTSPSVAVALLFEDISSDSELAEPLRAALTSSLSGGGGISNKCKNQRLLCRILCISKHKGDPIGRLLCYDSCDAAYSLCKSGLSPAGVLAPT